MLLKENFSIEHIKELQTKSRRDPGLIERTVYAFGLLEALAKVGMPFVFKGGTCLMLLLERPMRLSTDIDIVVEPNTDVDAYLEAAGKIFPFVKCEEQIRKGRNQIVKRHFKFIYESPVRQGGIYILLDILYEENQYVNTMQKAIKNDLLLTEGDDLRVRVPNVNSILGDKLTAFAPHTTGVPINAGKNLEVMKQMYDVWTLIGAFDNFDEVRDTYLKVAESEIAYRGENITSVDALKDTLMAAACIGSRGGITPDDYKHYVAGIREVQGHIYSEKYTPEVAAGRAPIIMYMAACLIQNVTFEPVTRPEEFMKAQFESQLLMPLKYLRKINLEAFAYAIKTDRLVGNQLEMK